MIRLALAASLALSATAALAQEGPGGNFLFQWDMNGDGQVTAEEAREKRGEVFRMFDMDESGSLSAEEWQMVADHVAEETGPGGGLQNLGNGQGAMGPGQHIHASMEPDYNDADSDGTVTAAEFVAATDKLFPLIDRNGDGIITTADFGRF